MTKMRARGCKHYAVMALGERWEKPKFLYDEKENQRLWIFARRKDAERVAREFTSGGNRMIVNSKPQPVKWIAAPVWVETMVGSE